MGIEYAWLNLIRTSVRETEVIAIDTFKEKRKLERRDIVQTLNRMSSALLVAIPGRWLLLLLSGFRAIIRVGRQIGRASCRERV